MISIIDVVMDDRVDYKVLIREIAKHNPQAIVDAYNKVYATWNQEAKAFADAGKKVNAIKIVRNNTGCSLKEAKEYVDNL